MVGWLVWTSYGSTHRWLVGRIDGWLDFMDAMDFGLYGRYGLYGPIGLYGVYGDYGNRRGGQLTNFLFARTCILVFEHRAHVFPCKSHFRVFFLPRSFRRPRAFFSVPSQTRAREKKKKRKRRKKEREKEKKIRFIRSLANRIFQP